MKYKLQRVCERDRDLLFEWANNKMCRENSFRSELISYEEYCRWFSKKLADQMCHMYIYYYKDVPIGQVCIDCEAETGNISCFIACEYRGQGHACNMLQMMEHEMQEKIKILTTCVKYDNVAFQMALKKNNYTEFEDKEYIKYYKEVSNNKINIYNGNSEGGAIVLTNNRNGLEIISYLEQKGENVSIISCKLTLEMVKRINPKIIVSYNYRYLLEKDVIDFVDGEVFNLHISLLPWNRGSNPNYWSFIENTPKGVTIHQIDAGLDTGDIVVQEEMFFDENKESFSSTYQKLNDRIAELFVQNWESLKEGAYKLKKQEGKGSYHTIRDFRQFIKGNSIDWNENIADYKRAMERRKDSCIFHMEGSQ